MQIYERAAISAHLQRCSSDPVTRQELPSAALTPIFLLRSRAMEYRDNTCAYQALSPMLGSPIYPYDMGLPCMGQGHTLAPQSARHAGNRMRQKLMLWLEA